MKRAQVGRLDVTGMCVGRNKAMQSTSQVVGHEQPMNPTQIPASQWLSFSGGQHVLEDPDEQCNQQE